MNNSEISNRYARVLFRMVPLQDSVESQLKDFGPLEILLQKPSEFLRFMVSPQFDDALKIDLLKRSLGDDCDPTIATFLLFLLKKKRLEFLPEIIKEYRRLTSEKLGIIDVRLISAAAVDTETNEKLTQKLDKLFQRKTQINHEIKPSLIGGGILMIGNKMLDASIRGKLSRLKKHLLKGIS